MAHGSHGRRLSGRRWQRTRERILGSEPLCRRCQTRGVVRIATLIHHVIALEAGGTDDDDNLEPICEECHDHEHHGVKGCDANGYPLPGSGHWWTKK